MTKKNGLSIVMYHYVRDYEKSLYKEIKGLDIKEFVFQIEYFKREYNVLEPSEVINNLTNNISFKDGDLWLTFDDGYIDHYKYVFPVLKKYNVRGSFFPPVLTTKRETILDVNKIHYILACVNNKLEIIEYIKSKYNELELSKDLGDIKKIINNIDATCRYDTEEVVIIKRLLQRDLPESFRTHVCDLLFNKFVSIDLEDFASELYMSFDNLKELYENGNNIGSHGYNHYFLNYLSKEKQYFEITQSLNYFSDIMKKNWIMCYPYGAYNTNTIEIIEKLGCAGAITTIPDSVLLSNYDKFKLPRWDTNDFPKVI
jgi:peptidoglycan/xylan/chitin deacetylase (PgdA/CDA1 family)